MKLTLRALPLVMIFLGVCAVRSPAATDDPVGWWKLDDASGTSATDSSGNSHSGTLQGGPVWRTNGVAAGALSFATNDYVSVSAWSGFDLTNQMAISVWIKPSGPGAAGPGFSRVLTKGDPYLGGWGLLYVTNSTVLFQMTGQYGNSIASAGAVPSNRWTHVVVTVSNSAARIYLDGMVDRFETWSGTRSVNTNGLYLGGGGVTNALPGSVDEVRIYSHSLTEREVMSLFLAQDTDLDRLVDANEVLAGTSVTNADTDADGVLDGLEIRAGTSAISTNSYPTLTNNLVGWYRFNEGSGNSSADTTSLNSDATFDNGTAWNTSGITSNSVTFDGINDRISCGNDNQNSPLAVTNLTISFWAYVTNRTQVAGVLDRANFNAGVITSGYFLLWDSDNNRITPMFKSSSVAPIDLDDVPENTWVQIAFSYNGSQIKSYLNGVVRATVAYSQDIGRAGQRLWLANPNDGPYSSTKYGGRMDELRVYDHPIADTYIAALADADSDNDGLPDRFERIIGTDPLKADTDGDGMPDGWEVKYTSLNPLSNDASGDADSDGLTNLQEYQLGTDPTKADTDGDGLPDGVDANPRNFDNAAPSFTVTYPSSGATIYP